MLLNQIISTLSLLVQKIIINALLFIADLLSV